MLFVLRFEMKLLHFCGGSEIGRQYNCRDLALSLKPLCQRLKFVFRTSNQHEIGSSFGKLFGKFFSQSAGSAGDKSGGTFVCKR